MRAIIAALNWASRPMRWLLDRIEFTVLAVDDDELSKGRPITTEEFERMLAVTEKVVGEAVALSWRFFLRGLWETGMRLAEAMNTSWDVPGTITPSWTRTGDVLLRFPAKRPKSRKTIEVGMPPGFGALLSEVPALAFLCGICRP
jgi:integrase